jgi:cytochrome c oxidase accessory protein FixG
MTTWKRYRTVAAVAEAILILGLPFLRINGESALRFDIPTLRLYLFGKVIWMQEFFVVLLFLLTLALLFIFITNLLGRVWCGWLCPQTVLLDIARKSAVVRSRLGLIMPHIILVPLSVLVSASLIWYFVSPYDFFSIISGETEGTTVRWFFFIMSAIIYLDLEFLGRRFCRTVCPYAKLQSTFFDKTTLVVEFDGDRADKCMGCDKCVRVCPVGIDIKNGLQMECIACAECIDACRSMTEPRGMKSLIGYTFGKGSVIRPKAVMLFALSLFSFLFLLYRLSTLPSFEFDVLRSRELYRVTAKGDIMNVYLLSIRNMSGRDLTLGITIQRPDTMKAIGPASVSVKAGEIYHQNVVLLSQDRDRKSEPVAFVLRDPLGHELKRSAVFFSP